MSWRLGLLVACQVLADLAAEAWSRYHLMISTSLLIPVAAIAVDMLDRLGLIEKELLALTPSSPWGVLSSALVHGGFYHLLNNLAGFATTSLLAALSSMISALLVEDSEAAARIQVKAFVAVLLLSQVLPSARLYVESVLRAEPFIAYGLSQVVYGLVGLVSSTCASLLPLALLALIERGGRVPRLVRFALLSSLTLLASAATILAVGVGALLSSLGLGIPAVNVRGHLEAFLTGLVAGAVILGHGYSATQLTLYRLRHPREALGVERARGKVIMKLARAP